VILSLKIVVFPLKIYTSQDRERGFTNIDTCFTTNDNGFTTKDSVFTTIENGFTKNDGDFTTN
jgi:hypothetical protein